MTPHFNEGVVLTRGEDTLDLRSRAIWCPNWQTLLTGARKSGRDRAIPGVRGMKTRPRVARDIRASLPVVLDGAYDTDGSTVVNVEATRRAKAYEHIDALLAFVDDDDSCTITVHRPADEHEGTLIVEDPGEPAWQSAWRVRFVLDVTLPDGRLTVVDS